MLAEFSKRFTKKEDAILAWLEAHRNKLNQPIYASLDIRNAGYKIAPVDTNLFPGGFNNLCPSYQKTSGKLFKEYLEKHHPEAKKILIIPESHTRNQYYFSNIKKIENILTESGFKVKIGSLNPEITMSTKFETADNETVELIPIKRQNNILTADDFKADVYLLNNDLSDGTPEILKQLDRPLLPPGEAGWHSRSKSHHFTFYNQLIEEFAAIVEMDPWFFTPNFTTVANVDFNDKNKLEEIKNEADKLIKKIEQKHKEHKIDHKPFVFIKNNRGTYGMGVLSINSTEDILTLNRKAKNQMAVGKGSTKIDSLIIQEGIPTIDRFKGLVAEPVMYLVNNQVAGGFFRLNEEKDSRGNLNSKGMKFTKLCFHELLGYSNEYNGECALECLAKIYKTIAQIASIAAGYEINDLIKA